MQTSLKVLILGLTFLLNRGIMAEHSQNPLLQDWVTVQNDQEGIKVDFPYNPIEISFDIPFQNTPPTGKIHVYSMPTQKGLLALSTFQSSTLKDEELSKEQLHHFFENILVPHFFFNPTIFQNQQTFEFIPDSLENLPGASFQYLFKDQGVVKKLKGKAIIKDHILYIPFYLASQNDFDPKLLERFLTSFRFQ